MPSEAPRRGCGRGVRSPAPKRVRRVALLAVAVIAALVQPATADAAGVTLTAVSQAAEAFESQSDPHLAEVFRAALLNPLGDATPTADGTVYVRTGNIEAEWLRDSSAQVRPYLYFAGDPAVREFIKAVIARQANYIAIDPYANAFTLQYHVRERKYELDSLCYPVLLAWMYWKVTGDSSVFTPKLQAALLLVLRTMSTEQHHNARSRYRNRDLPRSGRGQPTGYTGMIWSGFRPSDDACAYNYPIPDEMMAVQALRALAEMERDVYGNVQAARSAARLRRQVNAGIQSYGVIHTRKHGAVYAYEVDGLGHHTLMDDANVPSLLAAPYLGYGGTGNRVYEHTRRLVLSHVDPYYYWGRIGAGVGSAHTPHGFIWPMALVTQALTSTSTPEREYLLNEILTSDPGDHLLHESFNPNDPKLYTRNQFSWPNSLFSELVLRAYEGMPPLPNPSTRGLRLVGG